jgi:fibronectin type 3 domain-containing protein
MTGKFYIKGFFFLVALTWQVITVQGQDNPVIIYVEAGKVYLRWPALHQTDLDGYHVYRRQAGGQTWEQITAQPLRMLRSNQEIRQQAGYKADLYLQLFGADDPAGDISDQLYRDVINNARSRSFLDVMTLINPEFGPLMGVVFIDSLNLPAGFIQYKITTIINTTENDYAISGETDSRITSLIPVVTGLTGIPGHQSARLVWDKERSALESGKIVTYAVYRSDQLLGTYEKVNYYGILPVTINSGERTSRDITEEFSDKYLENGKTYYYYIRAVNAFGIEGPASATIEVIPGDDRVPPSPFGLSAQPFGTGLKLSWESRDTALTGFEVFKSRDRKGEYRRIYPLSEILLQPDTFMIDLDVQTSASYYYFVSSVGPGGIRSRPSDTIPVYIEDKIPPGKPGPVIALAEKGRIILKWPARNEEDILGYEIERASDDLFRSRFLLTNDIFTDTVFIDTIPANSQTIYGYVVYAVDRSYNRSAASDMVKARMPDTGPPAIPILTGLDRSGNLVRLTWTGSTEEDLAGFRIYRGVSSANDMKSRDISFIDSYTDTLESSGMYHYAVSALDSSGNESPLSGSLSVNYDEYEIPGKPRDGKVERTGNYIRVEWQAVDQPGTSGYVVTREEVASGKKLDVADLKAATTSYTDRFADPEKEYVYSIRTRDERWRMSEPLVMKYKPDK